MFIHNQLTLQEESPMDRKLAWALGIATIALIVNAATVVTVVGAG